MYEQLVAYHSENGHSNVPETHENRKLYRWCAVQRREVHLTFERKAFLDKLSFQWRKMDGKWDEFFAKLLAYKNEHGNVNAVQTSDKALNRWIAAQRNKKQQGLLSAERIEQLEQIGFVWKPGDIMKSAEFGRMQEMFEELALAVLRSVERPMKRGELIEEFRKAPDSGKFSSDCVEPSMVGS
jgi:Helicase associated domain